MPAGKIHDRITLACLPGVCLGTHLLTRHWGYTALVSSGFLFAGLMFGPDLDIRSVQSKRWGWLGWIWQPYRKSFRHRSWLTHGFLAGTLIRVIYLWVWGLLGLLLVLEVSNGRGYTSITWGELGHTIGMLCWRYWQVWAAIAIGIELGAMSHSLSDWTHSAWKRGNRRQRR
jgi:uncharacterized metal-binding protein